MARRKVLPDFNEVEAKRAAEKGEVSERTEALREDERTEREDRERAHREYMERTGRIAPEAPFVDDMVSEAELQRRRDAELIKALTEILKVPKMQGDVPVLSAYSVGPMTRRYLILDVNGTAYRRAWNTFKEMTGTEDAVAFVTLVIQIMDLEIPRLHRAVDWAPLNRAGAPSSGTGVFRPVLPPARPQSIYTFESM